MGQFIDVAGLKDRCAWPAGNFNQLVEGTKVPPITTDHIKGYFQLRAASDSHSMGDQKALAKGKLLLESLNVHACSIRPDNADVYFSGIVHASMKKSVAYNVKMKVQWSGEIINTECECAAGQGPYATCKHLAALALMLENFHGNKVLMVRQTCTENLQTFHHPKKKFKGD